MPDLRFEYAMDLLGAQQLPHPEPAVMYFRFKTLHIYFIRTAAYMSHPLPATWFQKNKETDAHRRILIWDDIWNRNPELVKSRLWVLAGQAKKIHARQTKVVRLYKDETVEFLNANHMLGYTSAYYKFGLVIHHELIAVATFSKARIMYDGPVYYRSYELERFASKQGYSVTGGLGKLLRQFTETVHAVHIMTYADRDWGEGESYVKLDFVCVETTPPQPIYLNQKTGVRLFPHELKHHRVSDPEWIVVYNSGNNKYILDLR